MKIQLTSDEVRDAFIHSNLEENYNFLEEDLVKLANAFVAKAEPLIRKDEREPLIRKDERSACLEIANNLNREVAAKIQEVRENAKSN